MVIYGGYFSSLARELLEKQAPGWVAAFTSWEEKGGCTGVFGGSKKMSSGTDVRWLDQDKGFNGSKKRFLKGGMDGPRKSANQSFEREVK